MSRYNIGYEGNKLLFIFSRPLKMPWVFYFLLALEEKKSEFHFLMDLRILEVKDSKQHVCHVSQNVSLSANQLVRLSVCTYEI